ncbi:MAG: hypothetical protein HGA80_07375, partial [Candidatus Omnitrophica bacterium]|nr:hypothetical protein [Candidatus Omnitrophota bacterium]
MKNNKPTLILLTFVFTFSNLPCRYALAEDSKTMVFQDEIFFAQEEIKTLKAKLAEQTEVLNRSVQARDAMQATLDRLKKDKELLQGKLDQSSSSVKVPTDSLEQDLKVANLALEEKSARVAKLNEERDQLARDLEKASQERKVYLEKLKEFQQRLNDGQAVVQSQIKQVTLPLEEKLHALDLQLAAKDDESKAKVASATAPLEQKIKTLEDQLHSQMTLRSEDLRVKVTAATSPLQQKIKTLEEQLRSR